ncbi:MAG TPA: preprotein translocase subunit SecG [Thermaerobacter sp.]
MQTLFLILHILAVIGLITVVLLQSGRSAGLSGAIAGGAEAFFGRRHGLDQLLGRLTVILAVVFFVTSFVLGYLMD